MKTFRHTLALVMVRYALLPLSVATGILMARLLGPEQLGLFALMIWLPSVLAGPMSMGLGNANLYIAAREPGTGPALVGNSIWVSVSTSVVVCGALAIAFSFWPGKLPLGLEPRYFLIPLLDLPFRLFNIFGANLFNAWRDQKNFRRSEIAQAVVYFFLCFAVVWPMNLGLWGFVYAQIGTSLAVTAYILWRLHRLGMLHVGLDKALLQRSVVYGFKVQTGSIVRVGSQKIDELILLHFSGPLALGFLTLARNVVNRVRIIPYSLADVIAPRFSAGDAAAGLLAARAMRQIALVMALVSIALLVAVGPLVPWVYGLALAVSGCLIFSPSGCRPAMCAPQR
jgi:O-antigen/teichoic acid export membrane protein